MYLKSLIVHGFKSFANKMVFEFNGGITCIVGPNGSGKSNVSDAVRWVLGEQSAKQLRGAKMEDIIFSGTELRKPQGFAYVAITLDNNDKSLPIDYEEVTVARRVYRSGESEYLINGNICRLKDIQELFLDTGIGKEGYSIIGQGQIDKILSGKPEERRELFDEAVGIVKFKRRKALAEKNLDEAKQHLCRIDDIIGQMEKQLEPLKKQSTIAKQYLILKEKLKIFDVNMFLNDYDRINLLKQENSKNLNIIDNDLNEINKEYNNLKLEYKRLETQLEEYNINIKNDTNILNNYKLEKEKSESEIKVLNEQINSIKSNEIRYKDDINILNSNINIKNDDLKSYASKKTNIEEELTKVNLIKKEYNNKFSALENNINNTKQTVENLKNEIIELLNKNTNIKTNLKHFETILEQNELRKTEFNQKILKNKSDEVSFQDEVKKNTDRLNEVNKILTIISAKNIELEQNINNLKQSNDILKNNINDKQQKYIIEKSKLNTLKNIVERYSGYGNSIKKIMERKEDFKGIIGVVADIIKVEKKYEIAIETSLGGSIQNIVTDNTNTAKDIIEYLKKNKLGRATFLPLTSIVVKDTMINQSVLNEQGVISIASKLVEPNEKYNKLFEFLLGRVVIVDNINNAIVISKKYNQSIRLVTLEGEVFNIGGSLTGGEFKNSSNLLSRNREIDELTNSIKNSEKEIEKYNKKLSSEQTIRENYKKEFEQNKEHLQQLILEQNTLNINITNANEKLSLFENEYKAIINSIDELNLKQLTLNEDIKQCNIYIEENNLKQSQNQQKIDKLKIVLDDLEAEKTKYSYDIAKVENEILSLSKNIEFINENENRIKDEIKKYENELKELQESIVEAKSKTLQKQNFIENIQQEISDYNTKIFDISKRLDDYNIQKDILTKKNKLVIENKDEFSQRKSELEKELLRLQTNKEKFENQIETKISYIWEEYELTYSTALDIKDESIKDFSKVKKDIAKLKDDIKKLGNVNVNAIQDYKELLEEFTIKKNNRDDLVKSEQDLKVIIEDLDVKMRNQFEERFEYIKKTFDQVFKELFGGGSGKLELIEDEDILEAGIKIIAQPPGKKLQNMMQLSGGEKALTAIAILFAIQNLKPSPFCLLDEIEAALDDANVKRFAKYLSKLTKDTQFIVITHRRGTMNEANVLYGITMQEKGVSTLVSVNIDEQIEGVN